MHNVVEEQIGSVSVGKLPEIGPDSLTIFWNLNFGARIGSRSQSELFFVCEARPDVSFLERMRFGSFKMVRFDTATVVSSLSKILDLLFVNFD